MLTISRLVYDTDCYAMPCRLVSLSYCAVSRQEVGSLATRQHAAPARCGPSMMAASTSFCFTTRIAHTNQRWHSLDHSVSHNLDLI